MAWLINKHVEWDPIWIVGCRNGDRLEDMIRDLGQESFQQAYAPMYDTLQTDSK